MPGPVDRKTPIKARVNPTHPLPPLNFHVQWSFSAQTKAMDLYWTDPALLPNNTGFDILGVNIYRSFDSEFGPYHRLNALPLGSTYYRDDTRQAAVVSEDVAQRFLSRGDEAGNWAFRVQNFPMTRPGDPETVANSPGDVRVWIDGVEVPVARVFGATGEVFLSTAYTYDAVTNTRRDPILPLAHSTVVCDYTYNANLLEDTLSRRTFYRATTVGYRKWDGQLLETPLGWTEAAFSQQMESLDYIWREAIRRNLWILDQGGERVKAFVHKTRGLACGCARGDDPHPYNDCAACFGTGIRGGYEGPYEILLAPPDVERALRQGDKGRYEDMTYDVWTGPQPLLCQRDFIVKLNGDRYSIGPVRLPTNRGAVLQQHFNVRLLDRKDVRYQVPVTGTEALAFPETRPALWDDDPDLVHYPQVTSRPSVPDDIEERGRTPVWENIMND